MSDSKQAEKSPQERIAELEKAYVDAVRKVSETKDAFYAAKDAAYEALQALAGYKEQVLVSVVQSQRDELGKLKSTPESRPADNL